jgi:hypothetical protein
MTWWESGVLVRVPELAALGFAVVAEEEAMEVRDLIGLLGGERRGFEVGGAEELGHLALSVSVFCCQLRVMPR